MQDGHVVKILVVDDDAVKRYSVSHILRNAGFDVTEAGTGEECLRLARQGFDLVVLDVHMPDMNGFDVCGQLKADPATASQMVLHVSGTSVEEEDRAHGLEAGADAYLTEPVDARVLVATVNSLLRLRYMEVLSRELLVSERAARDEALVQAERLREANAELTQLYEEMRRAENLKDEFLAMLGHELRNPLGVVSNALHILQRPNVSPEHASRAVVTAARQVSQLTRIVDDLLDMARVSRGKFALRRRTVQFMPIVEHAVEANRAVLQEREHQLTVSLPREPIWLDADPDRLLQALSNILGNAVKYTAPSGRIWIEVERVGPPAQEVELRVRDTGIGIPPELLPNIFELFTQAPGGLDRTEGGLGIGLSLVRSVAEMHGGTVSAYSAGAGEGAEFVMRLPVIPAPTDPAQPARAGIQPHARPVRVLVVEDNLDSAETLMEIIQLWGHTVATAGDGSQAIQLARRWKPEVVLLDIGLPGMDGYEVAGQLRRLHAQAASTAPAAQPEERPKRLVLVALTGYGQEVDRQRSLEAGFDHHLTKPVDLARLEELLAQSGDIRR